MNKKVFFTFLSLCFVFLLFMSVSACSDEIIEIEANNAHSWQKYMNEEEYNEIQRGMSYIEVVRISGGSGEEIEKDVYEWNDELLLTKGYRLKFQEDQLIHMEVVERKGHSTR